MIVIFDIGGTNFRYFLFKEFVVVKNYINKVSKNVLDQIIFHLNKLSETYDIDCIKVSIAGIVDKYKIFGCMNIGLKDNCDLIKYYKEIEIYYMNDGDAFLLGEIYMHDISIENKNILGLIFGTGVGCGLIMNGNLIKNCEIHKYLESYMKKNRLTEENIKEVTKFIGDELSKVIELLNLNIIVINGYVNKFDKFEEFLINNLTCNLYYKPKVIISKLKNSNIYGMLRSEDASK
jgi:predicted NBD/HSP70 family sugar kinase